MVRREKLFFSFERIVSIFLAKLLQSENKAKATILVYHSISSDTPKSNLLNDTTVSTDFEQQMQFLRKNSFNVIPLQELISLLETGEKLPKKTVVITFDDGYKSNFTNAYPILAKYNIPATIFLVAGLIGKKEPFPWLETSSGYRRKDELFPMSWHEVIELQRAGIEIGCHTLSHAFLPKMREKEIEKEILLSQATIEKKIGQVPRCLSLPFSFPIKYKAWPSFKSVLLRCLEKGKYSSCSTMIRGYVKAKDNPFFLKRIPILKFDDLLSFQVKLLNGYAWTVCPQHIFQRIFKDYRKL